MGFIIKLIDVVLHIDKYLGMLLSLFGNWMYLILFLVVFAETGFVFTPFLPGDSLLFAVGAFAAQGYLNLLLILVIFTIAAISGDSINYWIGSHVGEMLLTRNRFIKKEYLEKTKAFYKKYGEKTIILARFVPIVRTFAPFVAGIGKMRYLLFLLCNIVGGILWVSFFVLGGYFFGNLPFVQKHFGLFIIGIIIASFVPAILEFARHHYAKNKS